MAKRTNDDHRDGSDDTDVVVAAVHNDVTAVVLQRILNGLTDADDIQRAKYGVGDGKDDANRSAEAGPHDPADDVIGASSTDFAVGGNGRDGQRRHERDERREGNDDQRLPFTKERF